MGFWNYHSKLLVDGEGKVIYCDRDPCLEDVWGYFICRRVQEGDKEDPCAADIYNCNVFEAPIVDGKIYNVNACGVHIDCLEIGDGGGGVTVNDPDNNEYIVIYQINPDDQCYNEFMKWKEEAEKEGGTVDQELEKRCPLHNDGIPYVNWEGKNTFCEQYEQNSEEICSKDNIIHVNWSGYDDYGCDHHGGISYHSRSETTWTLKRPPDGFAPEKADGIVFCVTTTTYSYTEKESTCEETKELKTVKFGESVTVRAKGASPCTFSSDENTVTRSGNSIEMDFRELWYSYQEES